MLKQYTIYVENRYKRFDVGCILYRRQMRVVSFFLYIGRHIGLPIKSEIACEVRLTKKEFDNIRNKN